MPLTTQLAESYYAKALLRGPSYGQQILKPILEPLNVKITAIKKNVITPFKKNVITPLQENVLMPLQELKGTFKEEIIPWLLGKPPATLTTEDVGDVKKIIGSKYLGSLILIVKKAPLRVYRRQETGGRYADTVSFSVEKGIFIPSTFSIQEAKNRGSLAETIVRYKLKDSIFYKYQKYDGVSWQEVEKKTMDLLQSDPSALKAYKEAHGIETEKEDPTRGRGRVKAFREHDFEKTFLRQQRRLERPRRKPKPVRIQTRKLGMRVRPTTTRGGSSLWTTLLFVAIDLYSMET